MRACAYVLTYMHTHNNEFLRMKPGNSSSQECRDKQLLKLTIARGNVPLPAPPQAATLPFGPLFGLGWGSPWEDGRLLLDKDVRKWTHIMEWKSDLSIKILQDCVLYVCQCMLYLSFSVPNFHRIWFEELRAEASEFVPLFFGGKNASLRKN